MYVEVDRNRRLGYNVDSNLILSSQYRPTCWFTICFHVNLATGFNNISKVSAKPYFTNIFLIAFNQLLLLSVLFKSYHSARRHSEEVLSSLRVLPYNDSALLCRYPAIGIVPDMMYIAVSAVFTGSVNICFINVFFFAFINITNMKLYILV